MEDGQLAAAVYPWPCARGLRVEADDDALDGVAQHDDRRQGGWERA